MKEFDQESKKKFQVGTKHNLVTVGQERLLSLRKNKIDKYINNKRFLNHNLNTKYEFSLEEIEISSDIKELYLKDYDLIGLNEKIVKGLYSNDKIILSFSLFLIRKYYTKTLKEYSKLCDTEEVADRLCQILLISNIKIKFETIWIIINLTSHFNEFTFHLANEKNINILFNLLQTEEIVILQHIIIVFSNLVAESIFIRDKILNFKIFPIIINFIEKNTSAFLLEKCLKLIANIYRYKYKNDEDMVFRILKYVNNIFKSVHINERVYTEAISIVCNLIQIEDIQSKILSLIIESQEMLNKIFYYVMSNESEIELNCIVIIVNLTMCEITQMQVLIANGILDILSSKINLLRHEKIVYFSLRAISNISSGTISQLDQIRNSGIINKVLELYKILQIKKDKKKIELNIIKEIYYFICNCLTGGCTNLIYSIITNQLIEIESVLIKGFELFENDFTLIKLIASSIYLLIKDDNKAESSVKKKFVENQVVDHLKSILYITDNNEEMRKFIELLINEFEEKENNMIDEDQIDDEDYMTD